MVDVFLEVVSACSVAVILYVMLRLTKQHNINAVNGWKSMKFGFLLIFFGTVIDITDNFESLNMLILIGDTPTQAFLEKVVGYLAGFIFLAIGISKWIPKIFEHQQAIEKDLENTREEIMQLQGIVPICMHCKEIRDDDGAWNQLEKYIEGHSEAQFSHGICEKCMKERYGDKLPKT